MVNELTLEEKYELLPELMMGDKYEHQVILHRISNQLSNQLPENCEVVGGTYLYLEISYADYLDQSIRVVTSKDSYVEPDLMVLCDKSDIEIQDGRVFGVPAFIIEIWSLSTGNNDFTEKKDRYYRCGVQEYILIDPLRKEVYQYLLCTDYKPTIYRENPVTVPIHIFGNPISITIDWDSLNRFQK